MTDPINKSPRILITRLSHIGDCVLTLPMACAIKRAMPNAWIGWAMESPTHKLLADHPCIDQIIVTPKGWLAKPTEWFKQRKRLKDLNFDIALDPQGLTKSSVLGSLSKAPIRIGFSAPHGRELSSMCNNRFVGTQKTHLVDRSLDLLSHARLGIENPKVEFRLPIQVADSETIVGWLNGENLLSFLAINPGASWASKRWIPERFGYVARYAFKAFGIRSVVTWAGEEERAMAEAALATSKGAAILAPETTLGELAALFQEARTFIGCDTGPLHIAAAVGTQCIGLYGPTLPTHSGAYGDQHIAIQQWHQSDRNRKKATNLAMKDISVDEVCNAVDQVMADGQVEFVNRQAA